MSRLISTKQISNFCLFIIACFRLAYPPGIIANWRLGRRDRAIGWTVFGCAPKTSIFGCKIRDRKENGQLFVIKCWKDRGHFIPRHFIRKAEEKIRFGTGLRSFLQSSIKENVIVFHRWKVLESPLTRMPSKSNFYNIVKNYCRRKIFLFSIRSNLTR